MVKVSIISGAYNTADTLKYSIESILNQTYIDWEFIICDDGSTDDTLDILNSYKSQYPDKFVILKNITNMGLNITLNNCLKLAQGKYIARHDLDDLSLSNRLEKQVNFLDKNLNYAMVGSMMNYADSNGIWGKTNLPTEPLRENFLKGTPFCHATMMIRKETLESVNGYSTSSSTLRVEDYDLWFRLYEKGFIGYNIQEPLYTMIDDRKAYNRRKYKYRLNESYVMLRGYKRLNIPYIYYPFILKPLLTGLIPYKLYKYIRNRKYNL